MHGTEMPPRSPAPKFSLRDSLASAARGLKDWLVSEENATFDSVRESLRAWAGAANAPGLPALPLVFGAPPHAPEGDLRELELAWGPALDSERPLWELRLSALCVSRATQSARRLSSTWTVPWSKLPDELRERIVRSGHKQGVWRIVGRAADVCGASPN